MSSYKSKSSLMQCINKWMHKKGLIHRLVLVISIAFYNQISLCFWVNERLFPGVLFTLLLQLVNCHGNLQISACFQFETKSCLAKIYSCRYFSNFIFRTPHAVYRPSSIDKVWLNIYISIYILLPTPLFLPCEGRQPTS